jgi:hypothetical protein
MHIRQISALPKAENKFVGDKRFHFPPNSSLDTNLLHHHGMETPIALAWQGCMYGM